MQIAYDKQGFLDKVYRRSKSDKSKASAKTALKHFESFCMERFARSDFEVINEIKLVRLDVYKVLDSFVGYMEAQGLAATSITPYMSFVKGWLGYCEVEISETKFKNKVTMPVIEVDETSEDGPTFEEIERILSILPLTLKLLCMLILTTLRRPNELLRVRVRDIHFDKTPTTIYIVSGHSKNRVGRETFTTSEVTKMLKNHIKRKRLGESDYLFPYAEARSRVSIASHEFRYHMKKYLPDLDSVIEGTNRSIHRFTLYVFKHYGFTRAEKMHGTPFAKYLKGDKKSPYSKLSLQEKLKMYLQLEPQLSIFDATAARKALAEEQDLKQLIINIEKRQAETDKQMKTVVNMVNSFKDHVRILNLKPPDKDGNIYVDFFAPGTVDEQADRIVNALEAYTSAQGHKIKSVELTKDGIMVAETEEVNANDKG